MKKVGVILFKPFLNWLVILLTFLCFLETFGGGVGGIILLILLRIVVKDEDENN